MIAADDPRHGQHAGRIAGCREACCLEASYRYEKQRRLHIARTGSGYAVPAWRARRRLQALQALGWSLPVVAEHVGCDYRDLYHIAHQETVTRARFESIDATFAKLCMTLPTAETVAQRVSVSKTRAHAARKGFVPPLAWTDIDDPAEQPRGHVQARARKTDLDPVVVDRILAGDASLAATRAERLEVIRRWPGSQTALERLRPDWNVARDLRDMRADGLGGAA